MNVQQIMGDVILMQFVPILQEIFHVNVDLDIQEMVTVVRYVLCITSLLMKQNVSHALLIQQ